MARAARKPVDRTTADDAKKDETADAVATQNASDDSATTPDQPPADTGDDAKKTEVKEAGQQRAAAKKKADSDPAAPGMIAALEAERKGYVSRSNKERVAAVDAQLKHWKARA